MLSTGHIVLLAVGALGGILAVLAKRLSTGDPYSDRHTERGEPPSPHGRDLEK